MTRISHARKYFVINVEYSYTSMHLYIVNQILITHKIGIHIQLEIEQKKIKMNRTTIYCRRNIMKLTDELDLCGDRNILSNKDKYLKLVSYLGLKPKLAMKYPIKVVIWRIGKWKE